MAKNRVLPCWSEDAFSMMTGGQWKNWRCFRMLSQRRSWEGKLDGSGEQKWLALSAIAERVDGPTEGSADSRR